MRKFVSILGLGLLLGCFGACGSDSGTPSPDGGGPEARRRGIPPLMEATRARPALRMSAGMTFRLRATAALAVAVLWTAPVRSTCWSARI